MRARHVEPRLALSAASGGRLGITLPAHNTDVTDLIMFVLLDEETDLFLSWFVSAAEVHRAIQLSRAPWRINHRVQDIRT